MSSRFELGHAGLSNTGPRFAELVARLSTWKHIDSRDTFNSYCRAACHAWRERPGRMVQPPSALFEELLSRIDRREDETIPTSWGGVVVTLHMHPRVEKFLVIRQGSYLALEKHAKKDEHLEVREGTGLLLWRKAPGGTLTAEALEPGGRFHFEPGREHCIIGLENLLVFERSTDPKGMDQDLIFLYEPHEAA